MRADQKGMAAPPVLEFDEAGNFLRGWGGPGAGYDWPEAEHGIYVDPKGYVWIGGNGKTDHHLVKFTKEGKFVMQIGRKGESKGNKDTENVKHGGGHVRAFADQRAVRRRRLRQPAHHRVRCRHRRVQADVGRVRQRAARQSAAAGRRSPRTSAFPRREATGPGPDQFITPVHAVRVSKDGLVYVSDRGGKRVQVFTLEGKYVTQVFIDRYCEVPHCGNGQTVATTAFSHDPEQRFLYVASRSPARVWVLDRKTLEPLDSFGRPGVAPGEFYVMHHMNVDAKGNLYVTEVQDGKRIQKFVFKGYSTTP